MPLLHRNGVAIHVQGDLDFSYVDAKIHEAMGILQRLKDRNENYLEQIEQNCLDFGVRSMSGRDEIFIFPPPIVKEERKIISHKQLADVVELFLSIDTLESLGEGSPYTGQHLVQARRITPHAFTVPFSNKDIGGIASDYWGYLLHTAAAGDAEWSPQLLEGSSLLEWPHFCGITQQDLFEYVNTGCSYGGWQHGWWDEGNWYNTNSCIQFAYTGYLSAGGNNSNALTDYGVIEAGVPYPHNVPPGCLWTGYEQRATGSDPVPCGAGGSGFRTQWPGISISAPAKDELGNPGLLGGVDSYQQSRGAIDDELGKWILFGIYTEIPSYDNESTLYAYLYDGTVIEITTEVGRAGNSPADFDIGVAKMYIFDPPLFTFVVREGLDPDYNWYYCIIYYSSDPDEWQLIKIPYLGATQYGSEISDILGGAHFGGTSFRLCYERARLEDLSQYTGE